MSQFTTHSLRSIPGSGCSREAVRRHNPRSGQKRLTTATIFATRPRRCSSCNTHKVNRALFAYRHPPPFVKGRA